MKEIKNFEEVKENVDSQRPAPGGYIARIVNVEDEPNKEYLLVSFDIADGEFKNYYRGLYDAFNFWGGTFYRSYKEKALSMFKGFITSVEKSNRGYVWNWDESTLKGKYVGVILQEEEYEAQSGYDAGQIKTKLTVSKVVDVQTIKDGKFKVPQKKTIKKETVPSQANNSSYSDGSSSNFFSNDELPF